MLKEAIMNNPTFNQVLEIKEISFLFIIILMIFLFINIFLLYKIKKDKNNRDNKNDKNGKSIELDKNKFDFNQSIIESNNFFNDYLKNKFEFYLVNDLLPYFLINKEMDSKTFKEIKQNFFVDISTSLNPALFDNLSDIYTKIGLQLYINQYFISSYNKSQNYFNDKKFDSKRIIDAIIK